VLEPGARVPDATLYRNPGDAVSLHQLAAQGPLILVFYLFDWSST
jgi:peroxiredoxin